MRRKVLLILAVPALFMLSIFFLMSDIKNIPEDRMLGGKEGEGGGEGEKRKAES